MKTVKLNIKFNFRKTIVQSMDKVIVQCFCFFSLSLASGYAYAYTLPLEAVLTKTVALSGNQIFSVDQDVMFKIGSDDFLIKETWLIEGDKNLKLTAVGHGRLKELFRLVTVYNSKTKTTVFGKSKQTQLASYDFFERYLSIRSMDSFKTYLSWLSVSSLIRLSRAGGASAFAVGETSPPDIGNPHIWIDQDSFQLRKMRFLSQAEVSLEDYEQHGNISYPKIKKIAWGEQKATIRVTKINLKTGATLSSFYPQKLDQPSEISLTSLGNSGLIIQDFYQRFR